LTALNLDAKHASELIDGVPNLEQFKLVQELENASVELAQKYPSVVEWREIGRTSEGRPITALIIGSGQESVFLYGFTHPNEPIGSLTVEYLASRLAADADLRKKFGYRFILAKAIDVDGAKMNEGWFRGPFNLLTYAKNYYRPPPNEQAEWTFPIDYKTLHWNTPIPETKAIKKIIDEFEPAFTHVLHNADFCGVYYYLSHPLPSAYNELKEIPLSERLPLHRGEPPDEPYLKNLDEGIYHDYGASDEYEFISQTLGVDPATKINYGTDSYEYIRNKYDGFCLTCELPHFYDERIQDTTPTGLRRRDLLRDSLKIEADTQGFVKHVLEESGELLNVDSRLYRAIRYSVDSWANVDQTTRVFSQDQRFDRPATVAERFDLTVLKRFSQMPKLGMTERLVNEAAARTGHQKLTPLRNEIHARLLQLNNTITQESNPQPIPIRTLVRIQLQSALICLRHLDSNRS
jgi:hypothetical protein